MTDHRTVRLVIGLVGAIAVTSGLFVSVLAYQAKDIPEGLLAIATTALGALTSMLVSTRGGNDPQPVVVQQPEGEPVPVEEAGHINALEAAVLVLVVVVILMLLSGHGLRL